MEESKVELTKNMLILGQFYSTIRTLLILPPPQSKQTINVAYALCNNEPCVCNIIIFLLYIFQHFSTFLADTLFNVLIDN